MCLSYTNVVCDNKKSPIVRLAGFAACARNRASQLRFLRRRIGQAGQATVEFAVLLPILLVIILGLAEFARAWMVQQVLTNASREGCRVAVLPESTLQDIEDQVTSFLASAKLSEEAEISAVNFGATAFTGDETSVTVTSPFRILVAGFIPGLGSDIVMSKTTVMRHE